MSEATATAALPTEDRAAGLGRKIAGSTSWTFLGTLVERVMAFAVFALLVRQLGASDVGIVTLASIFIDLSVVFTNGGLPEALIRHENPTDRTFDTAFWTNIGLGAAFTALLAGMAPALGWLYAEPALPGVLAALSATFLLTALGTVHQARLARGFGFRSIALRGIAATFGGGIVALIMAFTGWGVWSLVAYRLVATAVSTAALWLAAGWVPSWRFDRGEARRLLGFGMRLTLSSLMLQLTTTVSLLIVGLAMSSASVGYYRVAGRLYDMVNQFVVAPVTQVALSAFAALQSDQARFAALYTRMTGVVALVAIATFAGMAALSMPLIELVFGERWSPSAPVLMILCLAAVPFCVNIFVWSALTARGAGSDVMRFGIVQLASGAIFAVIAAPFGMEAVALGQVLRAFLVLPYSLQLTARHTGVAPRALLKPLVAPLLASLPMVAALIVLQRLLPQAGFATYLGLGIPLGMVVYIVCLGLLAPRRLAETIDTLRQARRAKG